MRRKPLAALAVAAAVALALPLAALAGSGGLAPVDPASPSAERVADIYWLISAISVAVFLLVTVPLALFAVRYRARGRPRSVEGPQVRGNTNLELAWTAVPILIVATIIGYVFYKLPGITDLTEGRAPDLRLRVEGRQFYWQYEYPNGVVAIDRARVPLGRVVEVELTAPEGDVIHSFWVPALAGKRDAVPGRITTFQFRAERTGAFEGRCGEFCGIQHAAMLASVEALPAEEFDRWLEREAERQRRDPVELGRQEWEGVCAKCHRLEGEELVGPNLTPAQLGDAEAVETIVRNGRGAMPAVGQGWSDLQMRALIAYVQREIVGEEAEGGG